VTSSFNRTLRCACSLATASLLLLANGAVLGQAPTDAQLCASIAGNPDVAISYCTRAIDSGRYAGEDLYRLHLNRGVEWAAKGDHNRAIADYDAALRLNPKSADAHHNRGSAWANKGETDKAIADYDAAIRLDPAESSPYAGRAVEYSIKGDYARASTDFDTAIKLDPKAASAFFGRGRVRFYRGDFTGAAADLEEAHKLDASAYIALWSYLALRRSGVAGDSALKPYIPAATESVWPAPVIALFLGRSKPEAVVAAAGKAQPPRNVEQRCEAVFFIAQWHIVAGQRERALPLLKEAQAKCPKNFMEYEGALAELRRLGSK
jgi:tetratricopeptide (TPR) repeat protein